MPRIKEEINRNIFLTLKKIEQIATNCKKPEEAKTFMKAEYKARINKDKSQHKLDLMRSLYKKKLCLTPARKICERLCEKFSERSRIIEEKVMKWKMKDAYKEHNLICKEMNKRKKECNECLKSENENTRFRKYFVIFESVKKIRMNLRKNRKSKIRFLQETKTKRDTEIKEAKEKQDNIIEGIRIHDRPLIEERTTPSLRTQERP